MAIKNIIPVLYTGLICTFKPVRKCIQTEIMNPFYGLEHSLNEDLVNFIPTGIQHSENIPRICALLSEKAFQYQVSGSGFRVLGLGFWVWGLVSEKLLHLFYSVINDRLETTIDVPFQNTKPNKLHCFIVHFLNAFIIYLH